MFDLYNERAFVSTWWQWRNGGVRNGVAFYGMQQLADRVRHRDGAPNLLWVEGPHIGGSLQGAWAYRISHDGPLEYAEHQPAGPHTPADWYGLFGYLAVHNLAPVVEGEWADYARTNAGWACRLTGPRAAFPSAASVTGRGPAPDGRAARPALSIQAAAVRLTGASQRRCEPGGRHALPIPAVRAG